MRANILCAGFGTRLRPFTYLKPKPLLNIGGHPLVERTIRQLHADGTVEGSNDVDPSLLAIESLRRDEVPGIHSIVYDSPADCITITHDAHSREGFALGAVLAAEYTKDHTGLLTTADLFKF